MSAIQSEFESLFRKHHKELCNLAYNITGDRDAAKDIVQDVFYGLWKKRDDIQFGDRVGNYLFRATSHTSLNYLRSRKKTASVNNLMELSSAPPPDLEGSGHENLERRVRQAIDRLPARCRTIYLMSRHEGLKYKEIAVALKLSVKTVENQMGIALQKLREELKPYMTREFIVISLIVNSAILFSGL